MLDYFLPVPSLPASPGPYKVGSCVYEIPITDLPSTSPVPDPNITTLRFRLFYPTAFDASSTQPIYWLPQPQKEWAKAYAEFSGASGLMSYIFSSLTGLLRYTTISAVANAPLLSQDSVFPLLIFSHGLGGNINTYSSILLALASCGIVCATPEHRDGSSPIAFITGEASEGSRSIRYRKLSHKATPENMEARNSQLRIRLWELELLYSALVQLNAGKAVCNIAPESSKVTLPTFESAFNLAPAAVTWAGHSFGAATIFQFVKSVFWSQTLPSSDGEDPNRAEQQPLYTPAENGELADQITAESPVVLLDMWTMPLANGVTKWLWEQPLPCHSRSQVTDERDILPVRTKTISVMSEAFLKWGGNFAKTKAALSARPADLELERQLHNNEGGGAKEAALVSSLSDSSEEGPIRLYYVPKSAHLNQSDFGVLFPRVSKYLAKAEEPNRTIWLNVRAILQLMREAGLKVESLQGGVDELKGDSILRADEPGWKKVALRS